MTELRRFADLELFRCLHIQRIITLLVFLLLIFTIQAQNPHKDDGLDIIHLKNGKIVQGIIVKQQFGTVSVKIIDSTTNIEKVKILLESDIVKIHKHTTQEFISEDSIQINIDGRVNVLDGISKSASVNQELLTKNSLDIVVPKSQRQKVPDAFYFSRNPAEQSLINEQSISLRQTENTLPVVDPNLPIIPKSKRKKKIRNRNISGYRGFIDYAYLHGVGEIKNNRLEWATSHGYQFNPMFYIGFGASFNLTLNEKESSLPLFINPRINFYDKNVTPFWDMRIGYSVLEGKGSYFSTSAGISFSKKGNHALNLGLVYSSQTVNLNEDSKMKASEGIKNSKKHYGVGLRISYEF